MPENKIYFLNEVLAHVWNLFSRTFDLCACVFTYNIRKNEKRLNSRAIQKANHGKICQILWLACTFEHCSIWYICIWFISRTLSLNIVHFLGPFRDSKEALGRFVIRP